jgi:hypothetical protein
MKTKLLLSLALWILSGAFAAATLSTTFTNPTPAASDYFGNAVAAVGTDRVLIGASRDDTGATDAGAAYLFSTNGTLLTTFTNPTPAVNDLFGNSVAAVGSDRVLAGAPYDDTGATDAGAAYLFNTNGTLLTTFTNPIPAYQDCFGNAVAAVGTDKVLIAAPYDDTGAINAGAAYLFSTNGTLLTTFTNPTPAASDVFGSAVAGVGADKVLIGAYLDDTGAYDAGAAYLFSTNGTLLTTFTNPTPASSDYFGYALAAVGTDKVLIGAYSDNTGAADAGAAYLFSTNGALLTTFTNPTPAASDYFGYAVAAVGTEKVLIGAYNDGTGATGAGAAYLFSTNGTFLTTFTNPTPANYDYFGYAVAAVGTDKVLIGAYSDNTGATDAGAAYLFSLDTPSVTTLPATSVITNAATLNATVNPNGVQTTAWFEWGATTNYGTTSTPTNVGSGSSNVSVTNTVTGLTAGLTYHFRVVATNIEGLTCGTDLAFVAADWVVTTLNDGGPGSLREAITNVPSGKTIGFAVTGIITLTNQLNINKSLTIAGPGATSLAISGNHNSRVFSIPATNAMVCISGLTIRSGTATGTSGGGGIINSGNLTVEDCRITENTANSGAGGGVYNRTAAVLTLKRCSIDHNSTTYGGGGIMNDGPLLTVINCTISGNTAICGAGIDDSTSTAFLEVYSSTICSNVTTFVGPVDEWRGRGGGIYTLGDYGRKLVQNSIIAKNEASFNQTCDISGDFTSYGHNLFGVTSVGQIHGFYWEDLLNVEPRLGPLADNGGPTPTHALLPWSPALEAGDDSVFPDLATDQRGFARKSGYHVDIGAVEMSDPGITPPVVGPMSMAVTSTNVATGTLTASLNTTVFSGGASFIKAILEYGLTTNYGGSSSCFSGTNIVAESDPTTWLIPVTALAQCTKIHCRVVVTNIVGTTLGPDWTFYTPCLAAIGDANGDGIVDRNELNLVISNYSITSPWLYLTNVAGLGGTNVTFALSNSTAGVYSVLMSTNLADWDYLGSATPRFEFTDTNAPGEPQRFYRLRWP